MYIGAESAVKQNGNTINIIDMILTGKAKQDFEDWYTAKTQSAHSLLLVNFYNKKEVEQYAWYIEWFDSVGIYIDVFWSFGDFEFSIHTDNERNSLSVLCNSRQEATKQAIIHANELYNNRNNNQD